MNNNLKTGVYVRDGESFDFGFKTSLSASEKVQFVNYVTNTIVGENYLSIIRDLIFDFAIVSLMTSVVVEDVVTSKDVINTIEEFLNSTNIVEIVKANVEVGLIEELNKCVDENLEYRTGVHRNPIADSISHLLNTIERKLNDVDTDSMMEMAQIISGMSGELTAEKMVEAYANSDVFKQKHDEIVSDREKRNDELTHMIKSAN